MMVIAWVILVVSAVMLILYVLANPVLLLVILIASLIGWAITKVTSIN
jgi:hypothetical protein